MSYGPHLVALVNEAEEKRRPLKRILMIRPRGSTQEFRCLVCVYFAVPNYRSKSTFLGIDVLERRRANLLAEESPSLATVASPRSSSEHSSTPIDYMTTRDFQKQYVLSC